jgi:polar amino acid transport system substrate-binding protein
MMPLVVAHAAVVQRNQIVDPVEPEIAQDLAPTGTLRAAINFGNTVLAQKDAATAEAEGVSIELARALGRRLETPVELVPFDAAGKVLP